MTGSGHPVALRLAIDQGGHASRALLFDPAGRIVGRGTHAVQTSEPRPGWVEQDAEEVVRTVSMSIMQAMSGHEAPEVAAAGLATQRSSIVCWSRGSGRPLSPVISWQDLRASGWIRNFSAHRKAVETSTGLRLSAHYGAAKLHWCLEHLPEVQAAFSRGDLAFGPLASFLVYRFTRERSFVIDPANAARTLLFSLEARDWDPVLLRLFGIPREPLPRCVPTRFGFGSLPVCGGFVPLRIVTGDQSAALFSCGRPVDTAVYINAGTGAFVQRPCGPRPRRNPQLIAGIAFADGAAAEFVLEGTVNGAGSALRWLGCETGRDGFEEQIPAWLESVPDPPLFLNGVGGLGAPFWVPDFPSRFIGAGNLPEKAVAVVESIVFLIYENIRKMRGSGAPLDHIIASGGIARLDALCQKLADISGLPVFRVDEPEATALGLAFLLQDPGCGSPGRTGIWFQPAANAVLAARRGRWRTAMARALRAAC